MSSNVWHERRSSSFWNGTVTAWCGWTSRKSDVQTGVTWLGKKKCPACARASKAHKKAGRR